MVTKHLFYILFDYLCLIVKSIECEKAKQQYIQSGNIATSWWRYSILDVPRLWFQKRGACVVARNELDMDAPLLPLRTSGTDVQRLEMEANTWTRWRAPTNRSEHKLNIPFLCRKPHHSTCRRVCPLRSSQALWWSFVFKSIGNSCYRKSHRLTSCTINHILHIYLSDKSIQHILCRNRHKYRRHLPPLHTNRMDGNNSMRHGSPRLNISLDKKTQYI